MNIFREYIRLAIFAIGLLCGVQIPAFVDQYQKRVDAHLLEAQQSLVGFQQTAERYFDGDLNKLIAHYQRSPDRVFNQDALNVRAIFQREQSLQSQWDNLRAGVVKRTYYLLTHYNAQILQETTNQFSYTVPLDPAALGWGICMALLFAALFDTSVGLSIKTCSVCYHAIRKQHTPSR